MKNRFLLALPVIGISISAWAQTPPDFMIFDAQIGALQQRIDADASGGVLKPEAVQDLQGKQQELVEREARLKTAGTLTSDEKTAMALSIKQQQQRLGNLMQASMPRGRPVDPASLPAPTYVAPNGTTISGAPGATPEQTGVVPLRAPQ